MPYRKFFKRLRSVPSDILNDRPPTGFLCLALILTTLAVGFFILAENRRQKESIAGLNLDMIALTQMIDEQTSLLNSTQSAVMFMQSQFYRLQAQGAPSANDPND